jgi:hypothetical protein
MGQREMDRDEGRAVDFDAAIQLIDKILRPVGDACGTIRVVRREEDLADGRRGHEVHKRHVGAVAEQEIDRPIGGVMIWSNP